MTANDLDVPKASAGDAAHAIAKAGLSSIPVIGGPAVELFQYLIQPPLEHRRSQWMHKVGNRLLELESRGFNIEELGRNEDFVSVVMHASQIALRTHQEEKREALGNAVLNVAMGQSPHEALQHMFLEWTDTLSVLHLQILKLFQRPTPPPSLSMGGLSSVLEYNMPQLQGQARIYNQVWRDLYSRGLINTEGLNVTMSGRGLSEKRTSEIGDAFLAFISEPIAHQR